MRHRDLHDADLRAAVAADQPRTECFSVPVNDLKGGYEYPAEVRFEIQEQDLASYLRAADSSRAAAPGRTSISSRLRRTRCCPPAWRPTATRKAARPRGRF
jgi:hypothetical protein